MVIKFPTQFRPTPTPEAVQSAFQRMILAGMQGLPTQALRAEYLALHARVYPQPAAPSETVALPRPVDRALDLLLTLGERAVKGSLPS